MKVGRLLASGAAALTLAMVAAPSAPAVKPLIGRYEGVSPTGARVSLSVQADVRGRRYLANATFSCSGQDENGVSTPTNSLGGYVGEAPTAYPIDRGGVLRKIVLNGNRVRPPVRGRFRRASATVRHVAFSTTICDTAFDEPVRVRWVPGVAVRPALLLLGRGRQALPERGEREVPSFP